MYQAQVNKKMQMLVNEAQFHQEITLSPKFHSPFIAGDYLYVVEKNVGYNQENPNKSISLNGHAKLFKKIDKTPEMIDTNDKEHKSFFTKVGGFEVGEVVVQDMKNCVAEILFKNNVYRQVKLTGATIQEIVRQGVSL